MSSLIKESLNELEQRQKYIKGKREVHNSQIDTVVNGLTLITIIKIVVILALSIIQVLFIRKLFSKDKVIDNNI